MVKQGFEKILEKEGPSQLEAFPALPAPLCDKLKGKEDAVVAEVCSKQTKVPADQCQAMVKQGFEKILEKECPNQGTNRTVRGEAQGKFGQDSCHPVSKPTIANPS